MSDFIIRSEILEQPDRLHDTLHQSRDAATAIARELAPRIQHVHLVGCGDPLFISHAAKYAFRQFAGLPTTTTDGLEFVLFDGDCLDEQALLVAISQSGKTLQAREALRMAERAGAAGLAVTNMPDGPIARISKWTLLSHAGLSRSFPTKTSTALLTVLFQFAIELGFARGFLSSEEHQHLSQQLASLPSWCREALAHESDMRELAYSLSEDDYFRFIGTGPSYATALLATSKLKETSQTRVEANQLEEFMHLHAFTVRQGDPIFFLSPSEKTVARAVEIADFARAHGAKCYAITSTSAASLWERADFKVWELLPKNDWFTPIIHIVPLQLFAYHLAVAKGRNPDRPIGYDEVALQKLIYSDLLEGWFKE